MTPLNPSPEDAKAAGKVKRYGERDIIEQGQTYREHVMAMTAEGLYAKSDIAAELAHRDLANAALIAQRDELVRALEQAEAYCNELTKYVRHHSTCESFRGYLLPIALACETNCTCGASDALRGAALKSSTGKEGGV